MIKKLLLVLELIKFQHTIFALPFAFLGALLASREIPPWQTSAWILVAMIGARSAAMAFNQLADHQFDALNPRTQSRVLPTSQISRGFVSLFTVISTALFFFSAWNLNQLALLLTLPAIAIIFAYSFTKRVTFLSHLFLGLSLAIAPVGGWVAVNGSLELEPFLIGISVMFWVSGFDIIYACQDLEFDRKMGLNSIPQRFGILVSLRIAKIFHFAMTGFLLLAFWVSGLSWLSWVGFIVVVISLLYEHSLVKETDLSRINVAFFTVNGFIGIALLLFVGIDLYLES